MVQLLVNAVFFVLNYVAKIILSPIFSAISTVIPVLGEFFNAIITYLNYGLQFIPFFVKLLMIPKSLLVTFVGLFVGIFAFNLTIRAVGLAMAIYHYFKP